MPHPSSLIDESDEPKPPVAIPHADLSPEALRGVVESFVLREGTDYGRNEFPLEHKVAHVMSQLERGEAQILFDPNSQTVDIVPGKGAAAKGPPASPARHTKESSS